MPSVSVPLSAAQGLFSLATLNGSTVNIGPLLLFDAFPGDRAIWQLTGPEWQVSGDQITMDNTNGGNNYLVAIYGINQSVTEAVTFRIKAFGSGIVAGGQYAIQLILTDAGGQGGTILGSETVNFPAGTFSEDQFSITITPTAPAYYLYAYIFARDSAGTLTVWDAEVFQTGGALGLYGKWISQTFDLWALANVPMTSRNLALQQVGFYYGDISNVDNLYSIEHSIKVLSQFPVLIIGEPGVNTTSRQQQVQTALVNAGVQVYGYINVGVGESAFNGCMPPISLILDALDRCAAAGYTGAFFDGDGSIGVTQDANNAIYNHAHSKGLYCMPNTHPQDTFIGLDKTTLAAPSAVPTIIAVTDSASTLPPGTYDLAYTLTTYLGETTPSPIASVTIAAGQGISLSAVTVPVYTLGVNLYLSDAAGSPTLGLVQSAYGAATTLSALPASGATQPPVTNTAYVNNPNGLVSSLAHGDTILWESFYSRDDNLYAGVPEGGFANVFGDYAQGAQLAKQYGVGLCALAYQIDTVPISDYSDWINAYVLAASLGFTALCYSNDTGSNSMPWATPPPFPALGDSLTTSAQQSSGTTYDAYSDQGVIRFTATDSPVTRGYQTFASEVAFTVALSGMPATNAVRTTTVYEQSTDGDTWVATTLSAVTSRYFRVRIELQD